MRTKSMLQVCTLLVIAILISSTPAGTAAAERTLRLEGVLSGQETDIFQPPATISVHGNGWGNATLLGRFSVEYTVDVDLVAHAGPAAARFVAANGDIIVVQGSGEAHDTDVPGVVKIIEAFSITGGTGRFTTASGELRVERLVDVSTGGTSGTFSGTVVLP